MKASPNKAQVGTASFSPASALASTRQIIDLQTFNYHVVCALGRQVDRRYIVHNGYAGWSARERSLIFLIQKVEVEVGGSIVAVMTLTGRGQVSAVPIDLYNKVASKRTDPRK